MLLPMMAAGEEQRDVVKELEKRGVSRLDLLVVRVIVRAKYTDAEVEEDSRRYALEAVKRAKAYADKQGEVFDEKAELEKSLEVFRKVLHAKNKDVLECCSMRVWIRQGKVMSVSVMEGEKTLWIIHKGQIVEYTSGDDEVRVPFKHPETRVMLALDDLLDGERVVLSGSWNNGGIPQQVIRAYPAKALGYDEEATVVRVLRVVKGEEAGLPFHWISEEAGMVFEWMDEGGKKVPDGVKVLSFGDDETRCLFKSKESLEKYEREFLRENGFGAVE